MKNAKEMSHPVLGNFNARTRKISAVGRYYQRALTVSAKIFRKFRLGNSFKYIFGYFRSQKSTLMRECGS